MARKTPANASGPSGPGSTPRSYPGIKPTASQPSVVPGSNSAPRKSDRKTPEGKSVPRQTAVKKAARKAGLGKPVRKSSPRGR